MLPITAVSLKTPRGGQNISSVKPRTGPKVRMNEGIRVPKVRLIGSDGEQQGVVAIRDALAQAEAEQLDLVEISPNADPPVCRIMDYGKYQFEQSKKQAAAKKKQKQVQVKEIKFRPTTEEADYMVKLKRLIKFLEQGNRAKITMRFRGRELAHQEIGLALLKKVAEDLKDYGVVEQHPKREGRQMIMLVAPSKKK